MLARMQRNWITHSLLVEMNSGAATLKYSLVLDLKLNMKVFYTLAIELLNIYPREVKIHFHTKICIWLFITGFFFMIEKLETNQITISA